MKKIVFLIFFASAFSSVQSQEVGLRFGDVSGGNVAIDAVFATGQFNRLHGNISFGNNGVGIDLLWDFFYRPLGSEAFDWYIGVGPYTYIGNYFELGAISEIGIEYHFNGVPLAIGADYRPGLRIIDNTDLFWDTWGFNVRWVFGQ